MNLLVMTFGLWCSAGIANAAVEQLASMSSSHDAGGAASVSDKLYVWGGSDDTSTRLSSLEVYDPNNPAAGWLAGAAAPGARTAPGVFVLNGRIFSVGGEGVATGTFNNNVWRYDPLGNTWTNLNAFHRNTVGLMCEVINGTAYACGGQTDSGAAASDLWHYNPQTDSWTQQADLLTPVTGAGHASLNGLLYVIGGDNKTSSATDQFVTTVQIYDPSTNAWVYGTSLPWTLRGLQAAAFGSTLWLFAAERYDLVQAEWVTNTSAYQFDPLAGQWTAFDFSLPGDTFAGVNNVPVIDGFACFTGARTTGGTPTSDAFRWLLPGVALPTITTTSLAIGTLGVAYNQPLLATGGAAPYIWSIASNALPSGLTLDATGGAITGTPAVAESLWLKLRVTDASNFYSEASFTFIISTNLPATPIAAMMTNHDDGGTATIGGKLYVWTGADTSGTPLDTLEVYDPNNPTAGWLALASAPFARTAPGVFVLTGQIYSIGGEGPTAGTFNSDVWRYNPATDSWSSLNPFPRTAYALMCDVLNGTAYAFGGGADDGATLPDLWQYDPVGDAWSPAASGLIFPVERAGHAVCNGRLYVFGGDQKIDANSDQFLTATQVYDPSANAWSFAADVPATLRGLQAVAVTSQIWLFAAERFDTAQAAWLPNNTAYQYDPVADQWTAFDFYIPGDVFSGFNAVPLISGYAYFTALHNADDDSTSDAFRWLLPPSPQACIYQLSATITNVAAAGGAGSFAIFAGADCLWTATPGAGWLHTASSGNGTGTVSFLADANSNLTARAAAITVATQTFTITQPSGDTVGDGIPDWWRQKYFGGTGTNTNSFSCAACDPDGDGQRNLAEYLAGTDPTNSLSALRILTIARRTNDLLITWQTIGGKTNVVQTTANLIAGFTNLSPNIIIPGTTAIITNYLDTGGATNVPTRFYRVRLVP